MGKAGLTTGTAALVTTPSSESNVGFALLSGIAGS